MTFCGIFDGHGPWGHLVAKRVRELMPSFLLCNWQETLAQHLLNPDDELEIDGCHCHCQFDIWKQSYFKTCSAIDQELAQFPGIDTFYSGSTALTIIKQVMETYIRISPDSTMTPPCYCFLDAIKTRSPMFVLSFNSK